MVLVMTGTMLLAACGISEEEAAETLRYYTLQVTTTKDDFTLPKVIGQSADFEGIEVEWTSSNTNVIAVQDREGDTYLAKVTQDSDPHKVTLTVKHKTTNASKEFEVTVPAFDVYDFSDNYVLLQDSRIVDTTFALDSQWTYKQRTAQITWALKNAEELAPYARVEGSQFIIDDVPETGYVVADLEGTFSYNNDTVTKEYHPRVGDVIDPMAQAYDWYTHEGASQTFSGYVVGIGEVYSSYGNATLYIMSDNGDFGLYAYRSKASSAEGAQLKLGCHVTVTGAISSNFSGLWEATTGSTFVVDENIDAIDPEAWIRKADSDLTANGIYARLLTGSLVSITNWRVESVETRSDASKSGTILTVKKDGVSVKIGYSNYMNYYYESADNDASAELTAIKDEAAKYQVGDYISVTGLLSAFSNTWQILPRTPSDIKAGTEDTAETVGVKVKAAVTAVETAFSQNVTGVVDATKTFTMPTESNGVEISYKSLGKKNNSVAIEGGTWTITPAASLDQNRHIKVTYTIGDYTAYSFLVVNARQLDDAGKVAAAKEELTLAAASRTFNGYASLSLPTTTTGATVVWTIEDVTGGTWATVQGNSSVSVIVPPSATKQGAYTCTLKAAISAGDESDTLTQTLTFNIGEKVFVRMGATPQAGTYTFGGLYNGTMYYLADSAALDSGTQGYLKTTEDIAQAQTITLQAHEDGWYILFGSKYLEIISYSNSSGGTSYKFELKDAPTDVWKWFETEQVFAFKANPSGNGESNQYYYCGNYDSNKYTTWSASGMFRIQGTGASALDVSQHPARLGQVKTYDAE